VLDIGCGGGVFFNALEEFGHVEGVEPDTGLISDDPGIRSRIYAGPFDDAYRPGHTFGLILMLDVLEHLDDPVGALRHVLALLEPGGVILLTVPAFRILWTSHDVLNEHRTRYTKTTLGRVATASGLRFDHMEYFFHWTAAGKLAQHVLEKALRGTPKPAGVPPGAVNTLLYRLSRLEYRASHQLPVPFGSSLLAYGHRPAGGDVDAPPTPPARTEGASHRA
jgi:SAM-dependent methyltransferase